MKSHKAMTTFELLIALTIASLITIAATPMLADVLMNSRMNKSVNDLFHSLHWARQNANITGTMTVVCGSSDGTHCTSRSAQNTGWLVFTNHDGAEPPHLDPGDHIIRSISMAEGVSVTANRDAFAMRPFGLRSTNGTITWCDRRGPDQARAIVVSFTGKPRIRSAQTGGAELRCPNTL